jgi:hypothetical protein
MFRMVDLPGLDVLRIDSREERPMTAAFAAIVLVWSLAVAFTFV